MTSTRSEASQATGRDEQMNRIAVENSAFSSRISLRICAATVTSSGWVILSAISSIGFEISASTIIARCIMPPEYWNGYS